MRNLYTELAEYTNRPQVLVEARCTHASVELAWQFEKHKNDPLAHYRENDLYNFALTRYQMELQSKNVHLWYQDVIRKFSWKTGLDYGGGIGEQSILAMETGIKDMSFVEVAKSKTLAYAQWRFKKYNFSPMILEENIKPVLGEWDFVVAMDVFEHMVNPQPVIEAIARHTKYLFCNPNEIKYNWLYPQHISQYSLKQYFRPLEVYLFKSLI